MKKALLVGINYTGSEYELQGCINDVDNFYTLLTKFFGYKPENIVCLTETLTSPNHPKKQTIMDAIDWLLFNQTEGDNLVFYYSGHGSNTEDLNRDEKDRKDEVIVPLDFENAGVITDDWLKSNLVDKVKNNITLYSFFDSCNSGTVLDLKCNIECDTKPFLSLRDAKKLNEYNTRHWSNNYRISYESEENKNSKVYCFSSCLNTEVSNETILNGKRQGLFSYFFQELVRNNLAVNKKCTLKHREIIKDINAYFCMNNFDNQNCVLSVCNISDMNTVLNL